MYSAYAWEMKARDVDFEGVSWPGHAHEGNDKQVCGLVSMNLQYGEVNKKKREVMWRSEGGNVTAHIRRSCRNPADMNM